ncbi:MAG: HAMP domain-containing histidine kinase [Bacteroidales bacterium]|jgi:signal transduction histidine kinase|nr:HAMP domain-containing histidine kinase [Bacteroidales bacterium]
MNIKTRLSFQFTLIVAGILVFFSFLVYYFSYTSQLSKFRLNLYDSAKNTAALLLTVDEVDSTLLRKIQQSTKGWVNEEFALTDSVFSLIYGNNIQYLADSSVLMNNAGRGLNNFSVDEKDGICYRHFNNGRQYYVYAMAFDRSRTENLRELRIILLWSILSSLCLSVLSSYLFAKRAMRPISRIVRSVKEINSMKLSSRLDEGDRRDEIAQLAITFNSLLSELETAFRNQDDFVSNASHELRTPLTVMIGESDYVLSNDRSREEYLKHIERLSADLKKMNALMNSLLELARVNRNNEILFSGVRVDEIILNSIVQVKEKHQGRKILTRIGYPENASELVIDGNEGLLAIAFNNLIDNACKFSSDDIAVELNIRGNDIIVVVQDQGIGIPEEDLKTIFQPFSRGSNVKFIGGFGLGLSLVARIIEVHGARIDITTDLKEGTRIEMVFSRKT